jgi:peptide chain release factor subunit 1
MGQFNYLSKLAKFESGHGPCLSVYLRLTPNETGKKDHDVFLKKQFSEHLAVLKPNSDEFISFSADIKKIEEFLDAVDPSIQGAAIFACSAAGLFETFEFLVPFEQNNFFVFGTPHLYPLVRIVSQNPPLILVAADTNTARIFLFHRGETKRSGEIENVKTNRTEVGGFSQARYQRRIENFHQQHAKEVVAELSKLVESTRADKIILCGDETVIIPLLRDQLPKELAEMIIGTLPLHVDTPEAELLEAAEHVAKQADTLADKAKIDHLLEENYDGGVGVTGLKKTLAALMNGQVQELYLSANFDDITYNVRDIRELLANYEPGEDSELPDPWSEGMVVDELLKRAADVADGIRFIEDAALLRDSGGVGALLRYQAQGVSQ